MRVSDSASISSTKQFQLSIAVNATPAFTIVGPSDSIEPAQQPSIEITLTSALPSPISGQLTLSVTPNADVASDDPSIQFSTGGRTINFSIPANATRAVFSNGAPNIAFQTGTVSGQIELTASGRSGGSSPTLLPAAIRILTLSRRSPAITRLSIASRTPSGFELAITGFSTPRSLMQATFRFTAAQGASLETSTVNLNLATAAATWFQSQTAATLGGQFRLIVPFTIQGEMTAIQSVSVTLSNSEGTSNRLECTVLKPGVNYFSEITGDLPFDRKAPRCRSGPNPDSHSPARAPTTLADESKDGMCMPCAARAVAFFITFPTPRQARHGCPFWIESACRTPSARFQRVVSQGSIKSLSRPLLQTVLPRRTPHGANKDAAEEVKCFGSSCHWQMKASKLSF